MLLFTFFAPKERFWLLNDNAEQNDLAKTDAMGIKKLFDWRLFEIELGR